MNAQSRSRGLRRTTGLFIPFSRDRSGAAAVEFALVAIPFFGFVFVIFQVALFHFSQQSLDFATRMASRAIMTSQTNSGSVTSVDFKNTYLCPKLVMPLDCDKITVSVSRVAQTSSSINSASIGKFLNTSTTGLLPANLDVSKGTFCTGGSSEYLFIDVAYKFPNFAAFLINTVTSNADNSYMILRSTNFISNEPFSNTSPC